MSHTKKKAQADAHYTDAHKSVHLIHLVYLVKR